jgi:hypothetical protein
MIAAPELTGSQATMTWSRCVSRSIDVEVFSHFEVRQRGANDG